MNNTFEIPEGSCFSHKYFVNYSETDPRGRLSTAAAINCFQNLATLHSSATGHPLEWFGENHLGWVLLFWHAYFGEMPKEGEYYTAETWPQPHKRSQADRDFCLRLEDGTVFAKASSRWVLMNTERRRPAKLDPDFFNTYSLEDGRPCAGEDYFFDFPEDAEKVSEMPIDVMRHNTDTNGHVNNAVYIEWAIDCIPDDIYKQGDIVELMADYKKECRRGDNVTGSLYANGDDYLCVLHDGEDESKVFCKVLMKWTR